MLQSDRKKAGFFIYALPFCFVKDSTHSQGAADDSEELFTARSDLTEKKQHNGDIRWITLRCCTRTKNSKPAGQPLLLQIVAWKRAWPAEE